MVVSNHSEVPKVDSDNPVHFSLLWIALRFISSHGQAILILDFDKAIGSEVCSAAKPGSLRWFKVLNYLLPNLITCIYQGEIFIVN